MRLTPIEDGPAESQGLGLLHMPGDELTLIAMEEDLVRRVASELGQAHPERQPAATGRMAS